SRLRSMRERGPRAESLPGARTRRVGFDSVPVFTRRGMCGTACEWSERMRGGACACECGGALIDWSRRAGHTKRGLMSACGRELAKSAMVPERIAELMEHVALNLIAHARWVGTASTEADTEHAWLLRAAEDYLGIAGAARR